MELNGTDFLAATLHVAHKLNWLSCTILSYWQTLYF